MSAHRRARRTRHALRRTFTAAALAIASGTAFLVGATPAHAAGPWFVATTGTNANSCLSAASPCLTVAGVLAKTGFANGDTINVANGTYGATNLSKPANLMGASTAGTIFDAANAAATSALAVTAAGTTTISNVTLTRGNNNSTFGGGLRVQAGNVTTTNVDLRGNASQAGGGAIVYQGATLTMSGGVVANNTSTAAAALLGAGGGIYVIGKTPTAVAGTLVVSGTTFSNNTASGAAFAAGGNGGAIFNAGTTTITGATFSGNQAVQSSNTNTRRGQGGAIFNGPQDADDAPVLSVGTSTITGGLAAGAFNATSGGAIANSDTWPAAGSPVPSLTLSGTTLTANQGVLGGAVYNGGSLTSTGGSFNQNTGLSGGALYQAPVVNTAAVVTASVTGATFSQNTANAQTFVNFGNGGAIYNGRGLTLANNTFTGNKAVASSTAGSAATGWGGAIYNGPIATGDQPVLSLSGDTIKGGAVSGGNAVIGGAIANVANVFGAASAAPGKLTASAVTINGNVAAAAGGLYNGGSASFSGGDLTGNTANHASAGFGGGVYTARAPATAPVPTTTFDDTDVNQNHATVVGGGIAALAGTTVTVKGGSAVDQNVSDISAGGIYNAGALQVTDSSVSHNSAAFQGGGIYNGSSNAADSPSLVANGASVDGNTAANVGGGLLTLVNASASFSGGHLSDNSALAGGGAYVGDNAPASFDGTDFRGNTATSIGGGALLNSGTTSVARGSLTGNHAIHTTGNSGLGGAVYSGSSNADVTTSLKIADSVIAGNDAYAASAILTYSPGDGATNKTSVDNSTISGNSSSSAYGAIEQFHPLTITSSTITENTSDTSTSSTYGALAMFAPAQVSIAGTILSGNTGPECSGAVTDGGYNVVDANPAACGFTAAKHDVTGDPQLAPLANNGGPTTTQLPSATSPALDQVPAASATGLSDAISGNAITLCGSGTHDQRGTGRPQGTKCDIGAVEKAQDVPSVTGPATADYAVGVAGTPLTYTAAGSPQPTLSASGLPAGVTFTDNHDGTGTVAGTPAADTGGAYTVTITGTNEAGSGSATLTLKVHQAPVISGPAVATYRVGEPGGPTIFSQTKGYPTATLSSSGALPGGVSFTDHHDGTGAYAGTPAAGSGGLYPLHVTGSNGTAPDATADFALTVEEAPALTGPSAETFTVGAAGASATYAATGFPVPSLSASGLPVGLALTATGPGTARITGTPANGAGGVYDVVVTAANGVGSDAATHTAVTIDEAPEITGPSAIRFVAGHTGIGAFSADGYPGASLSLTGALPSGVTFTDNGNGSAAITGNAPVSQVGSYDLTLRASNGIAPDAVLQVTLVIAPPVQITSTTLPGGSVGTPYGTSVEVAGGAAPYLFSLDSGSLPAGLSLNATSGAITGTPNGPTGTSTFTVRVTDSSDPAESDTRTLSITIGKGTSTLTVTPVILQVTSQLGIKVNLALLEADLTGGTAAQPLAGRTVVFKAGATTVCTAVTNANGHVRCQPTVTNTLLVILSLGVTATWSGDDSWNPASASAPLIGS